MGESEISGDETQAILELQSSDAESSCDDDVTLANRSSPHSSAGSAPV